MRRPSDASVSLELRKALTFLLWTLMALFLKPLPSHTLGEVVAHFNQLLITL